MTVRPYLRYIAMPAWLPATTLAQVAGTLLVEQQIQSTAEAKIEGFYTQAAGSARRALTFAAATRTKPT